MYFITEKLKIGHSSMTALLYSPEEWTPSYITTQYTTALLGKCSDVVEVKKCVSSIMNIKRCVFKMKGDNYF